MSREGFISALVSWEGGKMDPVFLVAEEHLVSPIVRRPGKDISVFRHWSSRAM